MVTIAWDIDDVLNDLMRLWFEKKWLIRYPRCNLRYAELTENPPHRILGISKEEYLASLDEFRLSGQYRKMEPNREVRNWFWQNGKLFRHIAITAAPLYTAHLSAEWVLRHFSLWIRTFHLVPSVRKGLMTPQYDKNKENFLRWFGKVDIFIDDNEANIQRCRNLGIKCILFPRPWNESKLTAWQILQMVK